MPDFDRERVLALAAAASSEADQDPIDATIRRAAAASRKARKRASSYASSRSIPAPECPRLSSSMGVEASFGSSKERFTRSRRSRQCLPLHGQWRTISPRAGIVSLLLPPGQHRRCKLVGLIALSDPPREDSAGLIGTLRAMGIRTVMVTGDSPATATVIAHKVGIAPSVCPADRLVEPASIDEFAVFARVLPEQKYGLVKALQAEGHVVGMCGDGVNDAPALRQAQIGIAVSSATDVAKAAAAVVLTEPGLRGIVFAIREGRVAFQRLLTYTLNMLVKKTEIVLFLAIGLGLTGHAIMTPVLMVLLLVTNDFLSMSLTTDRASPAPAPSVWRMPSITAAAVVLAVCKLCFSTAILAVGAFALRLRATELQTLTFVVLVFGNQAVLYALRERRHMWASRPGIWVAASSTMDIGIVTTLALSRPLDGTAVIAASGRCLHCRSRACLGTRPNQASGDVRIQDQLR